MESVQPVAAYREITSLRGELPSHPHGHNIIKPFGGGSVIEHIVPIQFIPHSADSNDYLVKFGSWDAIQWEYAVYSKLQRRYYFPLVCEQFIDDGPLSEWAGLLLRRIAIFDKLFKEGTKTNTECLHMY